MADMIGFYKSKKIAKRTRKALGSNYTVKRIKDLNGFGLFRK